MSTINIDTAAGVSVTTNLPTGAWDLVSFFTNMKSYLGVLGGGVVGVIGLALVIWAVVLVAKKFFGSNNGQGDSWVKIIMMFIIGGAILTGGLVLITNISSGGQKTIEDLGGGFILPSLLGF